MIKPTHTFESVVHELREGLEKGTIVLDRPASELRPVFEKSDAVSVHITLRQNGQLVVDRGILVHVAQS